MNKNIKLLIFCMVSILYFGSTTVLALTESHISQYWNEGDAGSTASGERWGQTFSLPNAYRAELSNVGIAMRKYGNPPAGYITYWTVSGGSPYEEIGNFTLNPSDVSTECDWVYLPDLELTNPDQVEYAVAFQGGNQYNGYSPCIKGGNPYTPGQLVLYSGGQWLRNDYTDFDMAFDIYYIYNQKTYSIPVRTSPLDGATGVSINPQFTWNSVTDSDNDYPMHYILHIAGVPYGTTDLSFNLSSSLNYGTQYNWYIGVMDHWCFVRGCSGFVWSQAYGFTTEAAPIVTPTTGPISNVHVTSVSPNYITWNWTAPAANHSYTMIYKNGVFVQNLSSNYSSITFQYLDSNTQYTLSTRTVSTGGIINTTWVNDTAQTSIECPADSVCQLNATGGILLNNNDDFIGNTFKIVNFNNTIRVKQIESIQLMLQKIGNPQDICVSVYETYNHLPTNVLGTGCGDPDDIPEIEEALEWVFVLTDPIPIKENVEFAFSVWSSTADSSNQVAVFDAENTFPPFGQIVYGLNNQPWTTSSLKEVSYILTYSFESVSSGEVNWNQTSVPVNTTVKYTTNISNPSYFWNDYYAKLTYPNQTTYTYEITDQFSMPFETQINLTEQGDWLIQVYECWISCLIGGELGRGYDYITAYIPNQPIIVSKVYPEEEVFYTHNTTVGNWQLKHKTNLYSDSTLYLKNGTAFDSKEGQVANTNISVYMWNSDYPVGSYNITVQALGIYGDWNQTSWTWVVLPEVKYNLSGFITNCTGYPMQGAYVRLNENVTFWTGEDGYYNFSNVATGNNSIFVGKVGYTAQTEYLNVIADQSNLNFSLTGITQDLDPAGYIRDANTSEPISGALFRIVSVNDDTKTAQAYSDASGYWFILELPAGSGDYQYTLTHPRYNKKTGIANLVAGTYTNNYTMSANKGVLTGTVFESATGTTPYQINLNMESYNSVYSNANNSQNSLIIPVGGTGTWRGYAIKVMDLMSDYPAIVKLNLMSGSSESGYSTIGTCYIEEDQPYKCPLLLYETADAELYFTMEVTKIVLSGSGELQSVWVRPGAYVKSKTGWRYLVRMFIPTLQTMYANLFGDISIYARNAALMEEFGSTDDLMNNPPTAANPAGGKYIVYDKNATYLVANYEVPANGTYNMFKTQIKAATYSGTRRIGYFYSDDDMTNDGSTMLPSSGYAFIEGVHTYNSNSPAGSIYETHSVDWSSIDKNDNRKIKIWLYFAPSDSSDLIIYPSDTYGLALCSGCELKPLYNAKVSYYNSTGQYIMTTTDNIGRYTINVPLYPVNVYYSKENYQVKNYSVNLSGSNHIGSLNVTINKTNVNNNTTLTKDTIWIQPKVFTQSQSGTVYVKLFGAYSKYKFTLSRLGVNEVLLTREAPGINGVYESVITGNPGNYVLKLYGYNYCTALGCLTSSGTLSMDNFTIRSQVPSAMWASDTYFMGSKMQLDIDIPNGTSNKYVTVYYPNFSIYYSQSHSSAQGLQSLEFDTINSTTNISLPEGDYTAKIEGDETNSSVTHLFNESVLNYSINAPESANWGVEIGIDYLSPKQSDLRIYDSNNMDIVTPALVLGKNTYKFNTSILPRKSGTLTVALVQNGKVMASDTMTFSSSTGSLIGGDGVDPESWMEGWLELLPFGNGTFGKLMLSLIVTVLVALFCMSSFKSNPNNAAFVGGGGSFVAFIAIGFIPYWIVILLAIIILAKMYA